MRVLRWIPVLAFAAMVNGPALPQGSKSIDLRVVKYDGLAETVLKHRGKVVVVDFWGTY